MGRNWRFLSFKDNNFVVINKLESMSGLKFKLNGNETFVFQFIVQISKYSKFYYNLIWKRIDLRWLFSNSGFLFIFFPQINPQVSLWHKISKNTNSAIVFVRSYGGGKVNKKVVFLKNDSTNFNEEKYVIKNNKKIFEKNWEKKFEQKKIGKIWWYKFWNKIFTMTHHFDWVGKKFLEVDNLRIFFKKMDVFLENIT